MKQPKHTKADAGALRVKNYLFNIDTSGNHIGKDKIEIEYETVYGGLKPKTIPSGELFKPASLFNTLVDEGYLVTNKTNAINKINNLAAALKTAPKMPYTMLAGWHNFKGVNIYVYPQNTTKQGIYFSASDQVKVAEFLEKGNLFRWTIAAQYAIHSSILRLFIGAACAAPLLTPLKQASFGFVVIGGSSTGKSTSLVAAASFSGNHGDKGLHSFSDTRAALRQRLLGHRDVALCLDDTGAIIGDKKAESEFYKMLAMVGLNGRSEEKAGEYETARGTINADIRTVLLFSGENPPEQRFKGEEARLIVLHLEDFGSEDIFNGAKANEQIGGSDKRANLVDQLKDDFSQNQGLAHKAFVRKFQQDKNATSFIKEKIELFKKEANKLTNIGTHYRMANSFAITFGAAAFAIKHDILRWNEEATLECYLECFKVAINNLQTANKKENAQGLFFAKTDEELINDLREKLIESNPVGYARNQKIAHELQALLQQAEVIELLPQGKEKGLFFIKPDVMKQWYPNSADFKRLMKVLTEKDFLHARTEGSSYTKQVLISPISPDKLTRCVISNQIINFAFRA